MVAAHSHFSARFIDKTVHLLCGSFGQSLWCRLQRACRRLSHSHKWVSTIACRWRNATDCMITLQIARSPRFRRYRSWSIPDCNPLVGPFWSLPSGWVGFFRVGSWQSTRSTRALLPRPRPDPWQKRRI